ncbi:MAG: tetratricopeptide repeat protein [Chloroflexota bacterium]|nr:tetratricopeptide repeat protein [Chloroflexota bacterium]
MPTVPQSELPIPRSWDEFEDIVADLYSRMWDDPNTQRYGRTGQAQQGVDICGRPPHLHGRYAGVQCKRYSDRTLAQRKIEREIAKAENFSPPLAEYIIATTEHRDAKLQQVVRQINEERQSAGRFSVHVVFWEDLCSHLSHPANNDLLQKHYADWLQRFREPANPLQLLPRAQHFTGRQAELARLLADLRPGRVVTLCGPGGIGKTALAAEAIWTLAPAGDPPEHFPDGIIFHSFYNQPQAALALEVIARACGEEPRPSPAAAARRVLAGRRALLVLDGAEAADDLPAVLAVRGGCGVLVTSRARQGAVAGRQDLTSLPDPDAVQLLQAWGGARAADEAAARCICELVGRLPLAVRLAGRYLAQREEDAADYLAWLQETPLVALDQGQRQHESVPLLLDKSIAQVSEAARRALGMVGLLALSPFGREAVAAALDACPEIVEGVTPAEAGRLLGELVNYGLLLREATRYQVSHALVHTYARHRMSPPAGVTGWLAAYYTALAEQRSALGLLGYAVLDAERPHLMAILAGCVTAQDWDGAQSLAWAVDGYLDIQGHWTERVTAIEAGLAAARALDHRQDEGRFLGNLGNAYSALGEVGRAIEYYEQALVIAREIGDRSGEGAGLGNLGNAYSAMGEVDRAIEYCEQALAIAREIGDRRGEGNRLGNLGNAYYSLGEVNRAIEYYEQALEIAREIGDRRGEGNCLANMGLLVRQQGNPSRARGLWEQALRIYGAIQSPHAETVRGWLAGLAGTDST